MANRIDTVDIMDLVDRVDLERVGYIALSGRGFLMRYFPAQPVRLGYDILARWAEKLGRVEL